jgi:hypothetical protein
VGLPRRDCEESGLEGVERCPVLLFGNGKSRARERCGKRTVSRITTFRPRPSVAVNGNESVGLSIVIDTVRRARSIYTSRVDFSVFQ